MDIREKSYTVQLQDAQSLSDVHVIASTQIDARLMVAEDLGRGLWFGHANKPIVLSCRQNRLTWAAFQN